MFQNLNKQIMDNKPLSDKQLKTDFGFVELFKVKNPGLHVEGQKLLLHLLKNHTKEECPSLNFDMKDVMISILTSNTKINTQTYDILTFCLERNQSSVQEVFSLLLLSSQPKLILLVLGMLFEFFQMYGFQDQAKKSFFLSFLK